MATRKSGLYRSLWESCDELRGGMDASQYKDYVLTLLFVKYVSDKHANDPDSLIEVPAGSSFDAIAKLQGSKDIGDKLNVAVAALAEANDLQGVIDEADFDDAGKLGSGKEKVDRLSKLVRIFHEKLDFRGNRADGDDLLGDAYEYLMRHFAAESGKSKGQFYTPAEVSRVLAQVAGLREARRQDQSVYDPTCGSGSLLLKAADQAPGELSVFGQEMDHATWALARMNMILHGYATADLRRGNTLANPAFAGSGKLKTFDFVVANPPFSTKAWSNGVAPHDDPYHRFEYGVPPTKNGDYAFLLHAIASLKSTGTGAIVLPHGVLFRGNAEAVLRRNLLRRGIIKGVIGLPPNLFYGTGIPACIVVIDKAFADHRDHVFLVDASRGYAKDGNKNRLRAQDIHRIVDVFTNEAEIAGYSRAVPLDEIAAPENAYNLNLSRYIDTAGDLDVHDLDAHLKGGIPERDIDALDRYWTVMPSLRKELFAPSVRAGYGDARVDPYEVSDIIRGNPEFQAFVESALIRFDAWYQDNEAALRAISADTAPKSLGESIAEGLLERFADDPLLDPYAVYQRFMDYWAEEMQDDVYLLVGDGWEAGRQVREAEDGESPDFILKSGRKQVKYVGELIPASVIAEHLHPDRLHEVERLARETDEAATRKAEFEEEHAVEGGMLDGLEGDRGITKAHVESRVLTLKNEILSAFPEGSPEHEQARAIRKSTFARFPWANGVQDEEERFAELDVLHEWLRLASQESKSRQELRAAQSDLWSAVRETYGALSPEQIRVLIVDVKWRHEIRDRVLDEIHEAAQGFVDRITLLTTRYGQTLPDLESASAGLAERVARHMAVLAREEAP